MIETKERRMSNVFSARLKEWGSDMPKDYIHKFLLENKKLLELESIDDWWRGKKFRDFCFTVVEARNNGIRHVDRKREKELHDVLDKYTKKRIEDFKLREENKNGLKINREELKNEINEILRFVRAREALKESAAEKTTAKAKS